jgi:hypothetical protein
MLDKEAEKWLEEHQWELEPEEILSEEEKQKQTFEELDFEKSLMTGFWPKTISNTEFKQINTQKGFTLIISNPQNWKKILNSTELYHQWILPNAILLFGKPWFDKVKWRSRISGGVPFSMFTKDEKDYASRNNIPLENTSSGKAKIAKIVGKISHALRTYLSGEWYDGTFIKNPGGYLINSLKNDFMREIGKDMGFKLTYVPACPYCLSARSSYKVPLIYHGSNIYSCPRCKASLENSKPERFGSQQKILDYHQNDSYEFYGITCVCPSNSCSGSFVPFYFSESNLNNICKEYMIGKGTNRFYLPPEEMLDINLKCPFCKIYFTPREALELKSGYKQKSGYLTGLPVMPLWQNNSSSEKDINEMDESDMPTHKNDINCESSISSAFIGVIFKQRIDILVGELTIKISKLNINNLVDLHSWFFYNAAIKWMTEYIEDAARYFFDCNISIREPTDKEKLLCPEKNIKKVTNSVRGQDVAVHQSFFHIWLDLLEQNIKFFNKLDSNINNIGDLGWFCHSPKFSGGPIIKFNSEIGDKKRITNKTEVFQLDGQKHTPRLVKIFSIKKSIDNDLGVDYIKDIKFCEWHSIQLLPNSSLEFGDKVIVEALIMPGHHSHAPIQRIMRLRKNVLGKIINKVIEEELAGKTDIAYWKDWRATVKKAQKIVGLINKKLI